MPSRDFNSASNRDRLVFYPVAIAGGLFCLTVLMTIAAAFGDPQAPVNRWLNRNATALLLWETGGLVLVSVLAMGIDRMRTLRKMRTNRPQSLSVGEDGSPSVPGDRHVD